nr:MATE family efflux transporter [Bacillus andreraoultii]
MYTNEIDVATLITFFLLFALCFQFSDGIQASIQGGLRGYKAVNITLIATLCAYWVFGLPIGYAVKLTDFGPYRYWIGLMIGLAASAL